MAPSSSALNASFVALMSSVSFFRSAVASSIAFASRAVALACDAAVARFAVAASPVSTISALSDFTSTRSAFSGSPPTSSISF